MEFLTIFLQNRNCYCKLYQLVFAFCGNAAAVKFGYLLCYCKPQTCAAVIRASRGVKPEELLKQAFQLSGGMVSP